MNAFRIGIWEHAAPEEHYDRDGKRAIIKHLCYGPLETMIYGVTTDSTYYWEYHIIEGLEEGERFLEYISKEKMLEVDAALAISIGIGYPNERRTQNV